MSLSHISEAAHNYGEAFSVCYDYFNQLCDKGSCTDEESEEVQDLISHLDLNYSIFTSELYEEIKESLGYSDEQTSIFSLVKAGLPAIVFENELSDYHITEAFVESWAKYPNGYWVTQLIKMLSKSLEWFSNDNSYPFDRFIDIYNTRGGVKEAQISPQENEITPESLMHLEPEVCDYLLRKLVEKGFMPTNSEPRHFRYVFSGGICPKDFVPLTWNKSKDALSELLILLSGERPLSHPKKRNAGGLFIKHKKYLGKLHNLPKKRNSGDRWTLESIIKDMGMPLL